MANSSSDRDRSSWQPCTWLQLAVACIGLLGAVTATWATLQVRVSRLETEIERHREIPCHDGATTRLDAMTVRIDATALEVAGLKGLSAQVGLMREDISGRLARIEAQLDRLTERAAGAIK